MNSDSIKAQFGSYHVQVLHQSEARRVANLYSEHDGSAICRTLAVTLFCTPRAAKLTRVDDIIRQGQSIGTTLLNEGFLVTRELLAEAITYSGTNFEKLCAGSVRPGACVYIQVYELRAAVAGGHADPYAIIAEAHHPEHKPPRDDLPLASLLQWQEDQAGAKVALEDLLTKID